MTDNIRKLEPILPYPSRQSVIEAALATIERRFDADLPDDLYKEREPLFLQESEAVSFNVFNDVVNDAISEVEPAPWLMRDLKEFEQTIVDSVVEGLESNPEGRAFLDAMRSSVARHQQGANVK